MLRAGVAFDEGRVVAHSRFLYARVACVAFVAIALACALQVL